MDKCSYCKKTIYIPNWKRKSYNNRQANKNFFCGLKCYREWWKENIAITFKGKNNINWAGGKQTKICLSCQKEFQSLESSNAKFCSHSCSARWNFLGARNPRWKNGITDINRKLRMSKEYSEWRKKVYQRDRWTCLICKKHLKQLIAHHIKSWEKYPKLRFKVSNGITFCRSCHCRLHTIHKNIHDFTKILNDYMPNIQTKV